MNIKNFSTYPRLFLFLLMLIVVFSQASGGTFSLYGGDLKVIKLEADKNTGLNSIYVVYDVNDITASYTTSTGNKPVWYRYSNLGGGYAEELSSVEYSGNVSTLAKVEGDMGYIIEDGNDRYYCWIVNYITHRLDLKGIEPNSIQDCGTTNIILSGSGEPIKYFTINGQQRTLDQQIEIHYNTLEWNDESKVWNQIEEIHSLESFDTSVYITPAPLCNTTFTIKGDRFLKEWNWIQEDVSNTFYTNSIDARTEAIQLESDNEKSNIMNSGNTESLGGSAPADITFYAYTTDGVIHNEWQMTSDPEFEDITYRFTEQDFNYVFMEEGTMYVRYVGSNNDGTCEVYGDTYTVTIGESDLVCPNAFSPNASEGVNDEWKVSYKSIVEFECWIFNRWGTELFHFTDPELGWDGKYKGKFVKSGVYFYVVKAKGADGKEYKLSGDINILNYNETGNSNSNNEDPVVTPTE